MLAKRFLPLLALVVGAGAVALPAGAATTTNRVPVSGIAFNSCAGELMFVQGTIMVVTGTTTDESGGIHFGPTHFTQHGTAIGLTTGREYVFHAVQTNMENDTNGGFARTLTTQIIAVSKGNGPNLIGQATFHMTITPTGEITAFFNHVNFFRCAGG